MAWHEIAELVAAGAAVVGVIIALLSLRSSIRQLSTSMEEIHYSQLDELYLELLKMRIDNPKLAGPRPSARKGAERAAWDDYACCVWNFIETVLDYCDQPGKRNFRAWAPTVRYEKQAYEAFLTPENLTRFHDGFLKRVDHLIAKMEAGR